MPTVPYTGVPQIGMELAPRPRYAADVSPATFGANVGQALSQLGGTVIASGDELFRRGLAMQEVQNQVDARDADTKYTVAAGLLHAEFNAKQGAERVRAFPKYMEDLEAQRKEIGKALANEDARRMYDTSTKGTFSRSIFNAAGAAASAQRESVVTSARSQTAVDAKTVNDNPDDDRVYQDKLARGVRNAAAEAAAKGYPVGGPEQQLLTLTNTSEITSQRVMGLARKDPERARELLAENKATLTQDAYTRAEAAVKQGLATKIALDQTSDISTDPEAVAGGRPVRGLAERTDAARKAGRSAYPDDPAFAEQAADITRTRFIKARADLRDTEASNLNTVYAALNGDYSNGKLPTTVEELRADPAVADALKALPATRKNSVLKALANNAEGDYPVTEATFRRYHELRGLATSHDAKDRDAFFDTSLMEEKLPQKWRTILIKQREAMIKAGGEDPNVTRSMTQLRDAGIAPTADRDGKPAVDQYRGALSGALEVFMNENKRKPDPKELREIGSRLNQEQTDPNKWTFGVLKRTTPFYQQDVPGASMDVIKKGLEERGVSMTDEEIRREYLRQSYIRLYGKKPSTPSAPSAPSVGAPRSE